jgi:hypothetical protein
MFFFASLSHFSQKWLTKEVLIHASKAKVKARSEASRQNI